MPYTSYAKISDDDVKALYAYFMNDIVAVDTVPRPTQLPFPFNIRLSMWAGICCSSIASRTRPILRQSPEWNRGALPDPKAWALQCLPFATQPDDGRGCLEGAGRR